MLNPLFLRAEVLPLIILETFLLILLTKHISGLLKHRLLLLRVERPWWDKRLNVLSGLVEAVKINLWRLSRNLGVSLLLHLIKLVNIMTSYVVQNTWPRCVRGVSSIHGRAIALRVGQLLVPVTSLTSCLEWLDVHLFVEALLEGFRKYWTSFVVLLLMVSIILILQLVPEVAWCNIRRAKWLLRRGVFKSIVVRGATGALELFAKSA